jgi:hypothetical protein
MERYEDIIRLENMIDAWETEKSNDSEESWEDKA